MEETVISLYSTCIKDERYSKVLLLLYYKFFSAYHIFFWNIISNNIFFCWNANHNWVLLSQLFSALICCNTKIFNLWLMWALVHYIWQKIELKFETSGKIIYFKFWDPIELNFLAKVLFVNIKCECFLFILIEQSMLRILTLLSGKHFVNFVKSWEMGKRDVMCKS